MKALPKRFLLILCLLAATACTVPPTKEAEPEAVPQEPAEAPQGVVPAAKPTDPLAAAVVRAADLETVLRDRRQSLLQQFGHGLGGDEIGYYMDLQEARLRQELGGRGVIVTRVGDRIGLSFPSAVTFGTGSAQLNPATQEILARVANVVVEYRKTLVSILGHTDSSGSEQYNQRLSERRGLAFARELVGRGVDLERVLVVGYGESRPQASNDDEAGRELNRRVELQIDPVVR